jgi:uncharacterized membrane protein YesL
MTTVREPLAPSRRRGWTGPGFEAFGSVFGFVYTFLAVNFLLAAANAPLLFCLALVADPVAAWPFCLVLAVTVAPSLAGAFSSFRSLKDAEGAAARPVASFWSGYRGSFRRTAPLGLASLALLAFLGTDLALVQAAVPAMPAAAVLVPLIVVASLATVSVAVAMTAGVVLLPGARLRSLFKAALYISVSRWYLSLTALALLGIIAAAALVQPVLGVALAPAPLLFVVWSNAAYAFQAALRG